ncbi:MAG: Uma2 family endonuclease [Cyanomargarita calcarea GSE-NOS-MK-12-04C]|jgi:Uma2 family endonuclease|uniref:Uma2 family endonuclease n=1 Tax=Cyanomargarita calcarea GSE-NOS-MK-12-04C TaxID=2839659 RepID=A0A951UVT5_9CYAN|nr:Uma2 family endonuclease [Cyanomargarita calcarea GSE-NOS-MK-12-04C]
MTQALNKLVTFDEFVNFLQSQPENIRCELYDGEIIQVPLPTGDHEEIIAFLVNILVSEYRKLNLNYGIPKTVLVNT